MNKIYALLALLTLVLLPSSALAQTPTPSGLRGTTRAVRQRNLEVEEKTNLLRVRIQERLATREARLSQLSEENIRKYFDQMIVRMEAHTSRLDGLITRIESRITKINEAYPDIDTSEIEAQVEEAKELLAIVKVDIQAIKDNLETVLSSNDPKEAFIIIKEEVREIRVNLGKIHSILVHVIGDIKGLRVGQGVEAQPTPRLSPSPTPTAEI